jgi:hypothetical protein
MYIADGATANNLTELLMWSLSYKGGLDDDAIASKLLCFGADGVSAFQGKRTGVTAHKINLVVKTLSELPVFHAIEDLMCVSHAYFSHSPKKYNEYKAFASSINTKGLKLLKNVTTRWLSLLEPMRCLMSEFRTVLGKMEIDSNNKKESVIFLLILHVSILVRKLISFITIQVLVYP